jgi:hypothetical protein
MLRISISITEKLKRTCVFLLNKEHRNSDGKALLVSFAKTLPYLNRETPWILSLQHCFGRRKYLYPRAQI